MMPPPSSQLVTMPKATARPQDDPSFQKMTSILPEDHQTIAQDILARLSNEQLARLKSRLDALLPARSTDLANRLSTLPISCLSSHLKHLASTRPSKEEKITTSNESAKQNMASPVPTDTPTISWEQISRLPTEIRLMILDRVFEAVFVPGEIVPRQQVYHINEDCFVDSNEDFWYKFALRSFDNNLYEKYKNRYWSDNTWVASSGPESKSTDVFHKLPQELLSRIRSVRLVLSAEDRELRTVRNYDDGLDLLTNLDCFQYCNSMYESTLNFTWKWKTRTVFEYLQPEHLILDVSDAFAPNGNFLDLSTPSLFRFRYGVPKKLEIIAPREQLAEAVYRKIRVSNGLEET